MMDNLDIHMYEYFQRKVYWNWSCVTTGNASYHPVKTEKLPTT